MPRAERDPEDALGHERRNRVRDALAIAASLKQAAKRPTRSMARSVAPSSSAPASEVIAPSSNEATTARPSTGANRSGSGLHSVRIGDLLLAHPSRCVTTTLDDSEPRCTPHW